MKLLSFAREKDQQPRPRGGFGEKVATTPITGQLFILVTREHCSREQVLSFAYYWTERDERTELVFQ